MTGSLYSSMHIGNIVFRSPEQLITADNIDIDWSPFQYLSRGIAVNHLHVDGAARRDPAREAEPPKMPASLAAPFLLAARTTPRLDKVTLAKAGVNTVIADVRFDLHGDKQKWKLRDASAITPWG